MSSWEPVDIERDEISDEDVKWDDDVMKDLESRFEELRQYNKESLMKVAMRLPEKTRQSLQMRRDMISKKWLQRKCMIN